MKPISFRNKLFLKTSSMNYLHNICKIPKGFVLCKVACMPHRFVYEFGEFC